MKKVTQKIIGGILAVSFAALGTTDASAATVHFSDSTTDAQWTTWVEQWGKSVSSDYEQLSLSPGSNASELNFAWYSKTTGTPTPIVKFATKSDMSDAKTFQGTAASAIEGYNTNKVTVSGLKENTTYYYTYLNNGKESQPTKYTTKSFSNYKILFLGDPQIGASKGQTVSTGDKLENSSALNTAARNDAFSWNNTLNFALQKNPDIGFIISAGDQINKNVNGIDAGNEVEYSGFLFPSALKSLPLATTIGNHDATNKSYSFHFNNPNAFTAEKSPSTAGNGYYYTYGNALFIVLNTNNYNCADHEALIKKAVSENPNTRWRIVTIHQDIYGSGLDHSDSDGMILRTQLTPIFDKYNIDVVLQGHDHTYSRSYLLQGDGKTHASFDANKTAAGEFDWDNVVDKATGAVYPYYPEEGDEAAKAANATFLAENKAYTIKDQAANKVVNPQGTLYLTANSSTGSKFYELLPQQQDYIAYRNQNWKPSYSVLSLSDNQFSIATYSIDSGAATQVDSTFTIEKTGDKAPTNVADSGSNSDSANTSGTENQGTKANAPKTGDANDMTGTIVLSVIALLGLAGVGATTIKQRKAKVIK